MPTILVAGMCGVDLLFKVDNLPQAGKKYVASNATREAGGGALNAAIAISRLGGDASLAARVGNDWAGEFIKTVLSDEQINQELLITAEGATTAYSAVMVDSIGERQIINYRGMNLPSNAPSLATLEDKPTDILAALSDTRWEEGGLAILTIANRQNKPAVVDAEAPLCLPMLLQATHIAFSMQGLQDYDPTINPASTSSIARSLLSAHDKFNAWVCVTDGANGVYSLTTITNSHPDIGPVSKQANCSARLCDCTNPLSTLTDTVLTADLALCHHPANRIDAINTLAAGDVWHGAFTLHLAIHQSTARAIDFANAAAALKCMRDGGGTTAPTLIEVEHYLNSDSTG